MRLKFSFTRDKYIIEYHCKESGVIELNDIKSPLHHNTMHLLTISLERTLVL